MTHPSTPPSEVTVTVNGTPLSVPQGVTIMQAAERLGIHVPRLCYHPDLCVEGSCRVCIVEVEGMEHFMASCAVQVWDGMVVRTTSDELRRARRDIVELLLDNHPSDCLTCERSGRCELQRLASDHGVRNRHFAGRRKMPARDDSSAAVVRDPQKCVLCGRCIRVCRDVQGVYNLSQHYRGFNTVVGPADLGPMDDSVCIQCGQCVSVCPTAALLEKRHTGAVFDALVDPTKHVVVQTAPAIRAALGEGFGLEPGTSCAGQMVTALRRLGFAAVFDTNFAADLTIVEEGTELLQRLQTGDRLPLLTSCSPGWVSFLERFYPELIPLVSSCKSPMSMLSTLTKTYYAQERNLDPAKIFSVAVMPCVAKKYEAARPEHRTADGTPYTDAVLTTRELIWMLNCSAVDFLSLPAGHFDRWLGMSSGAADIFGTAGGVMEASLRVAAEKLSGDELPRINFEEVRGAQGVKEASVRLGARELRVAVANGLRGAKQVLDAVAAGTERYDVVEVMACPGGCIAGGGQPYPRPGSEILDHGLLAARARALYSIDQGKQLRRATENPAVRDLYQRFLGDPAGQRAHALLHTAYHAKLPRGIR